MDMSSQQYFESNGYVILKDVLNKQQCDQFVQMMFEQHDQGNLVQDEQCPESNAIYGFPPFEELLANLSDPLGRAVGRELLPTYTYARIYRPGEILKIHKDRPSCEISATMTLGFDAEAIWPIYFDEEKEIAVPLDVGELAVYKGCDVAHWRPAFKGQWHVQVFLHYVDANGPYKDHIYDGRPSLGVPKQGKFEQVTTQKRQDIAVKLPVYNTITIPCGDDKFPGFFSINERTMPELKFTKEECEKIIKIADKGYGTAATIGGDSAKGVLERSIRSADVYNINLNPDNAWIFEKVANAVAIVNSGHFDYDLSGITHELQLLHYKSDQNVPGHYRWHVDAGPGASSNRKISLVIQLTEPDKYEGCDLEVLDHGGEIKAPREQGSIHMFPSYMHHRVTPIEKGERYSIVIWVHGSRRFK